jgi:hypothetical protein
VNNRGSQSNQSDNDLLTEIEARDQELPMSLAWFGENVCTATGRLSFASQTASSTAAESCADGSPTERLLKWHSGNSWRNSMKRGIEPRGRS